MLAWHHPLDGCQFEQAPGVGDGQGGLACCGPRGLRVSDTTERLNNRQFYVSGGFNRPTGIMLVQGHLSSFFQMPFKENDFIGMELIYNSVYVYQHGELYSISYHKA